MPQNDPIGREIAAYDAQRAELVQHHLGKFVVFHGGELQGAYDTLDRAAKEALQRFQPGSFLIRQVGNDKPVPLPASVMYRPVYGTP